MCVSSDVRPTARWLWGNLLPFERGVSRGGKGFSVNNGNADKNTFLGIRREIWICLFLATSTLTVYRQVGNHDFISYDDPTYVVENPSVQGGLTLESVGWAFTTTHFSNWHPLTWLSYMIDCQLFGLDPRWHHLVNALFHVANALLLFLVFRRMTGDLWPSGLTAFLFSLHPLHVESVAWISERKDVLSGFFWMLTMLSYASYVERPRVKSYLPVLLFFALGLMSKPMLVTLPFVLLLLDYWPLDRLRISRTDSDRASQEDRLDLLPLWEKVPLLIIAAASSVVTFIAQQGSGAVASLELPLDARISNALVSYVGYIWKMLWPSRLAMFYPHPEVLPLWKVVGASLVLVTVSVLALRTAKKRPYVTVGWLWYLGTLVPVAGLVQVGGHGMADRYTYIPLIGLFVIIAWGVSDLVVSRRSLRTGIASTCALVLSIFTLVTNSQVGYWSNSITLYEHTLDVTSGNFIVHNNLGSVLLKRDRAAEAIAHFSEAIRIRPDFELAHFNLGFALAKQGKLDEASERFAEAIRLRPDFAEAHNDLGNVYYLKGRFTDAITRYSEATRLEPDHLEAHYNLGMLLLARGMRDEAAQHFSEALRIRPGFAAAEEKLAEALRAGSAPMEAEAPAP
jgi:Tfp pilus assembly protein PilF